MSFIEYALDENVAVVTLNSGENRFNPDFLGAFLDVLDEVENETQATTLVVKSSHEKIFSNGIDLEWLVPVIQKGDIPTAKNYFYQLNALFKRIVTYPMIAVAAITGHAFAGGAILCCAFDFRFMRSDRGYFCFPEVDLGIPFLPGMNAMLKKAIPLYKLEEMEYSGKRLTAEECEQHHIITKACHINQLMDETLAFAKTMNKKRAVIKELKKRLNKDIIHALDVEDVPYIESGKFNI
ncbi:MAG: enoyl-CoA hydratase/isomerase family protein [Thermodesulfobacteriota bacterium]|nr:enoyl-CoA hydratase/isomerase family protein [Thermodesulfobacteriota bacterium]